VGISEGCCANNDEVMAKNAADNRTRLHNEDRFEKASGNTSTILGSLGHSPITLAFASPLYGPPTTQERPWLKKKRLHREDVDNPVSFASKSYSKEERIAEMTAAMLCSIAGIEQNLGANANDLPSWRRPGAHRAKPPGLQ
jgi:antirestriction protein ArdC